MLWPPKIGDIAYVYATATATAGDVLTVHVQRVRITGWTESMSASGSTRWVSTTAGPVAWESLVEPWRVEAQARTDLALWLSEPQEGDDGTEAQEPEPAQEVE